MAADLENDPLVDDQEDRPVVSQPEQSSDADLEQYGVWVKVAPEDIVGQTTAVDDFDLDPLSPDDEDRGAVLTDEEEQLLGKLEDDPLQTESETDLGDLADIALDDFPVDIELGPTLARPTDTQSTSDVEHFTDTDEDLGNLADTELDDFPDIDFDSPISDLDDELESFSIPNTNDDLALDIDDVSSLEFDESDDILSGADDELNTIELNDIGQMDIEEDLMELVVENEGDDLAADLGLDSLDLEDDALDLFAEDMPDDSEQLSDGTFDDLVSLESDLQEGERSTLPGESAPPIGDSNLERIELELQSIKDELLALRAELSTLKNSPHLATDVKETDEIGETGFFTEDEDETISLSSWIAGAANSVPAFMSALRPSL